MECRKGSQRPAINNSREERPLTRMDLIYDTTTSQALSQEMGSFARQEVCMDDWTTHHELSAR